MRRFLVWRFIVVWLVALVTVSTLAESPYQVLRSSGEGFAQVVPGRSLAFPEDHLPHPEFRIEWWYLTANLTDREGRPWGGHWTLFRQSLAPEGPVDGWSSREVWMAHAALSTPDGHRYEERFARGGIGQAGVGLNRLGQFDAWLDDWQLLGQGPEPLPGMLTFSLDNTELRLELNVQTPWVKQGAEGYSQKSDQSQASYYYSQPHIQVTGTLQSEGESVELTGKAWLDREWSSQPLAPDQPGWDWFSIHLEDGHALMVYRLRNTEGKPWLSGTWVQPDGRATTLNADDIELEALETTRVTTGDNGTRNLPLSWSLALPRLNQYWQVKAAESDHWLDTAFPYWEGPIRVTGTTPGVGYLELTGY